MKSFSAISFLFVLVATSCSSGTTTKKRNDINKDTIAPKTTTFKMLSNDSLTVLLNRTKRFAEKYKPVSNSELGIALLTNVPDSITYSFRQLRIRGNNEYAKYLTLILAKVYQTHLKCCHQGYELRNNIHGKGIDSIADPLLYEFNLISKTYDNTELIEFINSGFWQI
jgi:hypothetical protein